MDLKAFTASYRIAQTPAGEIAYVDVGSGPVVLFVHGVSVNSALWRRVIGMVSAEFRCLAIDLPLHGRSAARSDHDYSLSRLADGLLALLDTIDVNRVHLVGNNSGGAICQVFAAANRQRLRSLVLTNCDTRGNIPPPTFARTVELAQQGRMAPSATRWINNLDVARSSRNIGGGYRDPRYLTDEVIRHFLTPTMGNEVVAREFERFLVMAMREEDLLAAEPCLRQLDVPTAIIWAVNDIFFAPEWAEWLAKLIPGAGAPIFIDDAALYFPDERSEALVPHLLRHWRVADV